MRAAVASAGLGSHARTRTGTLLALGLGFLAFLPYPALAVGGSSAIQAGNVLAILACIPVLLMSWRRRPFWMTPLLMAPLLLSTVKVAVSGGENLDLCLKEAAVWAVSCTAMLAVQAQGPRYSLELLTGAALATVLHVAVGAWQAYCFSSSTFPFAEIYVNPSFLSVQDNAKIIARYIRRPFGLFPEPSAMAACLAPWALFWGAELLGLVRLRREPARWQRVLFGVASVGTLALMIVSQSGHCAITLAMATLLAGAWLLRSKANVRTYLTLAIVFCVILPAALYFGAESVGERLAGKSAVGNSSWEERSESLVTGFWMWVNGDAPTVMLGMGAGMSAPALMEQSGINAVFSVLLTYVYETGVVGALTLLVVGAYVARIWRQANFNLTFAAMFIVWVVGITLTTSYQQLLPLWMTLGWLTVWPGLCAPAAGSARIDRGLDLS